MNPRYDPSQRHCAICQSNLFWLKAVDHEIICATCHPPPAPDCVREWIEGPPAPEAGKHSIDPKTGIWPISEWGPECGRGLDELDQTDAKKRIRFRAAASDSILVWSGKYVDRGEGPEEEYITWIDYIWSIQPKPGTIPPESIRLSATCGDTPVEIRKVDEEHWHLFVLTRPANKFVRRKDFNTFFREHAERTAEAWYGPAKEGWKVQETQ